MGALVRIDQAAMTILIISGEFDLSVGAIYAVAGLIMGLLAKHFGLEARRLPAAGWRRH
jgi:ribose/xylose/arabinose/galactoside ABC-type transport system permease subunit